MAWTTVNCSECGTEYNVQMYGPGRDRTWKTQHWNGHCDACESKHIAQRDMGNAASAAANKAAGLVALEGSPRQVQWAETIRAQKLAQIETVLGAQELGELTHTALDVLRSKSEASYWIDNRNLSGYEMLTRRTAKIKAAREAAAV